MRFPVPALTLALLTMLAAAPAAAIPGDIAVLQGLDKITARISTFEAPLDQPVRFGSLQITARACDKKPPEETPETTAFLEIVDVRPDTPEVALFTGWMFASSPAVSALEHPVYDVWVIDCKQAADAMPEATPDGIPEAPETKPDAPQQ